jgi:hypothetical protein
LGGSLEQVLFTLSTLILMFLKLWYKILQNTMLQSGTLMPLQFS